jgi:hypothetical protein
MPEPVERLRRVLADEIRRGIAVVACGDGAMAAGEHPSNCSRITWQFTHAAGSFVRYEAPRA